MAEVSKTGDAVGRGSWRSSFLGAPGFPGSWGEGRKIQATASVPKKTVSLEGCTSFNCAQFCAPPRSKKIAMGGSGEGKQIACTGAGIQHHSR